MILNIFLIYLNDLSKNSLKKIKNFFIYLIYQFTIFIFIHFLLFIFNLKNFYIFIFISESKFVLYFCKFEFLPHFFSHKLLENCNIFLFIILLHFILLLSLELKIEGLIEQFFLLLEEKDS
jgi:hypothetical protein